MQAIYETSPNNFTTNAGVHLSLAVKEVLSRKSLKNKTLSFNGVTIRIYPDSCEEDICEKYDLLGRLGNDPCNWG